jgi:hypothetical protein
MKTCIRVAMAAGRSMRKGKVAPLLIASALAMGMSSMPAKAYCTKADRDRCAAEAATKKSTPELYYKTCVYQCTSDPRAGFGSYNRVTLPPPNSPPRGRDTGIPVTKTPSNVGINAQPNYFRPK